MESMPTHADSSEINHQRTYETIGCERPSRAIGQIALHPTYDRNEDAHSALGGGVPAYKDDMSRSPTGIDKTILFSDEAQRGLIKPQYIEIRRAYDLSLDKLTSHQFNNLSMTDQKLLAVAGHAVVAGAKHRARILRIDGNFEHPSFAHYEFPTQEEANVYADLLAILHQDLLARDVIGNMESTYHELKQKSRPSTFSALTKKARELQVVISRNGKVIVGHKLSDQVQKN